MLLVRQMMERHLWHFQQLVYQAILLFTNCLLIVMLSLLQILEIPQLDGHQLLTEAPLLLLTVNTLVLQK